MGIQMTQCKSSDAEELNDKLFFEHFYEQHKQFLYYVARQRCHNGDDVQEVVQESWVRLLKHISALKEINERKTPKYIALTVRAVYIDLEVIDRKAKISRLKEGLSARDWFVLEGKYILGDTDAELAKQLDVAPDSIRMILTRAKSNARAILLSCDNKGGE